LSGDNLRIDKHGRRVCKECMRMHRVNWKAAHPVPKRGTPKAFCKHGHAMTPENTHTYKGRRSCKRCALDRVHKSRERKRLTLLDTSPEGQNQKPPEEGGNAS
jgi:hypothetical protein